jgi:glutathione S-transferase
MDKFYFIPFGCSLVAHGLMLELGHPHEAVRVQRGADGLGDATFAALNPARTVPVLATEAFVLTQSTQVLLHLAERHASAQLLPVETAARRDALGLLGYITSDVHPSFRPLLTPERFVEGAEPQRELHQRAAARLETQLALLEARLGQKPYLLGERMSLLDPYVLVFSLWCAHVQVAFPARLSALAKRVSDRPGYQRAIAIERAAQAQV